MRFKKELLLVLLAIAIASSAFLIDAPPVNAQTGLCYVNDCTVGGQNCHCCIEVVAGFNCFLHCGEVHDCVPMN